MLQFFETLLLNPLFGLFAALVLTVIGTKLTATASDGLLIAAWCLFILSVFRTAPISHQTIIPRSLATMLCASIAGLALLWLSGWQPASPTSAATRDDLTGGDSFAYLVPQPHAGTNVLPLAIWNHGDYILNGVTVRIRNLRDFTNPPVFIATPIITVGVLAPHGFQLLTDVLHPQPDKSGIDYYWIELSAQNGMVVQNLQIRRGNGSLQWAYRYNVTKTVHIQEKDKTTGVQSIVLDQMKWSDDFTPAP